MAASAADGFAIRWNNFDRNLVENVKGADHYTDVTLGCYNFSRRCHRIVLAASSTYFKRIFDMALADAGSHHPMIILHEVDQVLLNALVDYMYHGVVTLPKERLEEFYLTAKSLEIKGLLDSFPCFLAAADNILTPATPEATATNTNGPFNDLSLLANAATNVATSNNNATPSTNLEIGGKRRKTHPKRLVPASSPSSSTPGSGPGSAGTTSSTTTSILPESPLLANLRPNPYLAPNLANNGADGGDSAVNLSTRMVKSEIAQKLEAAHAQVHANASVLSRVQNIAALRSAGSILNIPQVPPSFMARMDLDIAPKTEPPSHSPVLALDMSQQSSRARSENASPGSNGGQGYENVASPSTGSEPDTPQMPPLIRQDGFAENLMPLVMNDAVAMANAMAANPALMAIPTSNPETTTTTPNGTNNTNNNAMHGNNLPQNEQNWKSRQPRECEYCKRVFSNKFNLKQHIQNMHQQGQELVCELCHKTVKNKWYLRRHHVTHHNAPLKK